ncbi:hypothetical protein [Massilibacterium senegalense]|nr:hypothetical protein [Massilibacterium senegalense]
MKKIAGIALGTFLLLSGFLGFQTSASKIGDLSNGYFFSKSLYGCKYG